MVKLTDIRPNKEKKLGVTTVFDDNRKTNGYQTNKKSSMNNISFQGSKIVKEHKMNH